MFNENLYRILKNSISKSIKIRKIHSNKNNSRYYKTSIPGNLFIYKIILVPGKTVSKQIVKSQDYIWNPRLKTILY